MIKSMFALTALAIVGAAPAAAQMATDAPAGNLPKCSATVRDSCQQGADNARAMTAAQAMASGGVGDRGHDDAAQMGGGTAMMSGGAMHKTAMHRHHMMHHHMMKQSGGATTTTDTTTSTSTPQ